MRALLGVVDAGEIEDAAHVDTLVSQHPDAEGREVSDPRVGARVVLVVARHEVHAVLRAKVAQRLDQLPKLRHRAVDEVPP